MEQREVNVQTVSDELTELVNTRLKEIYPGTGFCLILCRPDTGEMQYSSNLVRELGLMVAEEFVRSNRVAVVKDKAKKRRKWERKLKR